MRRNVNEWVDALLEEFPDALDSMESEIGYHVDEEGFATGLNKWMIAMESLLNDGECGDRLDYDCVVDAFETWNKPLWRWLTSSAGRRYYRVFIDEIFDFWL